MNQPKQWLNEAKKLCDEIGPEDGVDPRLLARSIEPKPRCHKVKQLCKEAKHTLSLVLAGELYDPLLKDMDIVEVTADENGQFLCVSMIHVDTGAEPDENLILNKLQAIQGYLRSTIAQSVKRKRVPTLKFKILRAPNEEFSNAYSKNN